DPAIGMTAIWAPGGDAFAVGARTRGAGRGKGSNVTLVLDPITGARKHATDPSLGLHPDAWDKDGGHRYRVVFEPAVSKVRMTRRPGKADPKPLAAKHEHVSPDGKYRVHPDGGALAIVGPRGERRFTTSREDDAAAIDALLEGDSVWLPPHGLLL